MKARYSLYCVAVLGVLFGVCTNETVQAQTVPFAAGEFIRKVDSSLAEGIQFGKGFKADFNGDDVVDRVVCSDTDHSVTIYDGSNLKSTLYRWDGPAVNEILTDVSKPNETSIRSFTSCVASEITPGVPSIVISATFIHPVNGFRIESAQFVLLNLGKNRSDGLKMEVFTVKRSDGEPYRAAARSVKCTPYPQRLVKSGKNPGALCFYAGYDQGLPKATYGNGSFTEDKYGDATALLKFEEQGGELIVKDLTGSSGLPWKGGVYGTPMQSFPIRLDKYDGLSMMGGAWLDYDKDGLPDLVTVGQHSSIRASKMSINTAKSEGISFTTSNILTVGAGTMSEFLTVSAISEQDKRITLPCVYISGEVGSRQPGASGDVPDHMRCYENGSWKTYMLPGGKNYSSAIFGASTKVDSTGRILVLAPNYLLDAKGGLVPANPATNLFEINPMASCQVTLESQYLDANKTTVLKTVTQTVTMPQGSKPKLGGWVDCGTKTNNAYFTGTAFTSGSTNITQLGWWNEETYLARQSAFNAIQWKASTTFTVAPSVVRTLEVRNGCASTNAKITATVVSCTTGVLAQADVIEDTTDSRLLGASTVQPNQISQFLVQLKGILEQLWLFVQ